MYDALLQEFNSFVKEIREITFQEIQKKFEDKEKGDPECLFNIGYTPQKIQYQEELHILKSQQQDKRNAPAFDKNRTFNNMDNLHRQVITLFKSFLMSQIQDFREYLAIKIELKKLNVLLNRIRVQSQSPGQFNLIYYLFTASKRSIRLFIKLRDEVLKQVSIDKNSFLPISTHNPSKYVQKQRYLQQIAVSRKNKQWQHLMGIAGFQYHAQLAIDALKSEDKVSAHKFIQYCLWINKHTIQSSPKK